MSKSRNIPLLMPLLLGFMAGTALYANPPGVEYRYGRDSSGEQTLSKIFGQPPGYWRGLKAKETGFGFTDDVFWLELAILKGPTLKGPMENTEYILLHDIPLTDSLILYEPLGQGRYRVQRSGREYTFSARPLSHHQYGFPFAGRGGGGRILYVRMESISPIRLNLKLYTRAGFRSRKDAQEPIMFMYYGFLIVMFFYNTFILYSTRKAAYLYYILYILGFFITSSALDGLAYQYLWPEHTLPSYYLLHYGEAVAIFAFSQFVRHFTKTWRYAGFMNQVMRGISLASLLFILVRVILPFGTAALLIMLLITSSLLIILPYVFYLAIFQKNRQAKFLAVAFTGLILAVLVRMVESFGYIHSNAVTQHSFQLGSAFEVIILSLGLADRINNLQARLRILNRELESRVRDRILSLRLSLREIRKLKDKQDGDYFLASLLGRPLQENNNFSRHVRTEFLVNQHKQFRYQKWDSEIGGDICLTDSLRLGERKFTAFVNADAMGKSMQGAGGALMLGAFMKSRYIRNRAGQAEDKTPEVWLEETYLELLTLFQTFNGSMLIAMVLGLVDEENGMLYYMNLEFPRPVLYSAGRAEFLKERGAMAKMGAPGRVGSVLVQTYRMKPGDIIVTGSDGKDDIILRNSEGPGRFNLEQSTFLEYVREGQGKLSEIRKILEQRGEIRDDLSLLSISYQKEAAQLETPAPGPAQVSAKLEKIKQGQKQKAERELEILHRKHPESLEILEQIAEYHHGQNQLKTSLIYARSLYLRRPRNQENLQRLLETCLSLGEIRLAEHYINQAQNRNENKATTLFYRLELEKAAGDAKLKSEQQKPKRLRDFIRTPG